MNSAKILMDDSNFKDSFSLQQKAAVVKMLLYIAESDDFVHEKELDVMKQVALLLGIEFTDSSLESMDLIKTIETLDTLHINQKEWLVIATHTIVVADGMIHKEEKIWENALFEAIEISQKRRDEILSKSIKIFKNL